MAEVPAAAPDPRDPAGTGLRAAWRAAPAAVLTLALAVPAASAAALALPATVASAVDAVLAGNPMTGPLLALVGALLLGLTAAVLTELAGPRLAADLTAGLRRRLAAHLTDLGTGSRNPFPGGDVTARLVGSAPDAAGFTPSLLGTLGALVTSLGAVIALAVLDPPLAAAFVVGLLPGVLVVRLFVSRATDLFTRYQEVQGGITARLTDALAGARTIHACGTRDREVARVLEPLPELSRTGHRLWEAQRTAVVRILLLAPVVELAVLSVAGWSLAQGRIPPGAMVAAAGYAALGLGILEQIEALVGVAHARAGRARAAELLAVPAAPHGTARVLPPGGGELVFRGVGVTVDGRPLLRDVDLTVPAGACAALVGVSGSGKSVLAALAGRLRDPDTGEVLLDGIPVTEPAPGGLRRAVAYAFPRPVLVGADIREALTCGRPDATDEEVTRAARIAHADGFVRRLPEGYRTPLEGLALSGGERQRLGLARALVQDARVLVLDDATSGLDTVTEHQVRDAFRRALPGRTRLVVAHRTSAAADADLVAWLDDGRVRAVGTHARLWEDPDYRAVFGGSKDAEGEPTPSPRDGGWAS